MSYYPEFARTVEQALARQDRSQSWLAQRLGVNHSTVNRWLNLGTRPRNPQTIVRIADILGPDCDRQSLMIAAGYGFVEEPVSLASDDGPQPHNLPIQVTSLIGRDNELSEVSQLLKSEGCRLLTVWGLGGIGKTRLGLAVATDFVGSAQFSDGVYYVPLAPLSRWQQMMPALAAAIDFPLDVGDSSRPPAQQLLDYLRAKRLLLLLDNLEHLPEAAKLATDILQTANGVKVLATSRERLHLPGEHVYPLSGLSYPAEDDGDVRAEYGAVELFIERARQHQPDFEPQGGEWSELYRICRGVDGLPLALELAAAWIDTLSISEIRQELAASLGFLATDAHSMAERHSSMEIAFGASWRRLDDREQRTFSRLSVFRGGFTREAAHEIADVRLDDLYHLVGKSFVRFSRTEGRYHIHELLRQYGTDRLKECKAEKESTGRRHAGYFCEMLELKYEALKGGRQLDAMARLTAERGNLQVAWERALVLCDLSMIEQAMDGLGRYHEWTGNITGGAHDFATSIDALDTLEDPRASRLTARALAWLANFALLAGDSPAAERNLEICSHLLDELEVQGVDAAAERAMMYLHTGDLEQARDIQLAIASYERSIELFASAGLQWQATMARSYLGRVYQVVHDDRAGDVLEELRRAFEEFGDLRGVAKALDDIAIYEMLNTTDLDAALEASLESVRIRRELGDKLGLSISLNSLGGTYGWLGEKEKALLVLNEALMIARQLGHRVGECRIIVDLETAYRYIDSEKSLALAEQGLVLARELGQARYEQYFLSKLCSRAIKIDDRKTAYHRIVQAFEVMQRAGIPVAEIWPHYIYAHAAWLNARYKEAHQHIIIALRRTIERSDLFNAVHVLRFLALIGAHNGRVDRAVEIEAAVRNVSKWDTFPDRWRWYVEPMEALTAELAPSQVTEAHIRGQSLDVFDIAAQLLQEVQSPTWRWDNRRETGQIAG